jgi:hypothetical protein
MMIALDDYLKKASDGTSGVPINYYLKDIIKGMLCEMWVAKYCPNKQVSITYEDGATPATLRAPLPAALALLLHLRRVLEFACWFDGAERVVRRKIRKRGRKGETRNRGNGKLRRIRWFCFCFLYFQNSLMNFLGTSRHGRSCGSSLEDEEI